MNERPRKVKYITQKELNEKQNIKDDIAPLTRSEKIKNAEKYLEAKNLCRIKELEYIQSKFRHFLNIDFEIDRAKALLNTENAGEHHLDNLQLLLKYHNGKKNNNNWSRFNFEEQKEYILKVLELQKIIDKRTGVATDENIVNSLLLRLQQIYQ